MALDHFSSNSSSVIIFLSKYSYLVSTVILSVSQLSLRLSLSPFLYLFCLFSFHIFSLLLFFIIFFLLVSEASSFSPHFSIFFLNPFRFFPSAINNVLIFYLYLCKRAIWLLNRVCPFLSPSHSLMPKLQHFSNFLLSHFPFPKIFALQFSLLLCHWVAYIKVVQRQILFKF